MFSHPLPEQLQYYTSPPAMAPPPNPFHPSYSRSSSFPSFDGSGPTLTSPSFGAVAAVKNEPGQPSSSSNILSFGGQPSRTLSFSGGDDWPDAIEAVQPVPERRIRTHLNTQEHVVAERRRREKMQQQFVALATIVPDLTKTDKISLLGGTIEYVKQLEQKVKALEEQSARRSNPEHTVFKSKCRISSDDDASSSRPRGSAASSGATSVSIPTVEASIHGDTVLLKICCRERRGVLVMVISELENQGLSIINTSVLPFTDSCLSITITAKARLRFPLQYACFSLFSDLCACIFQK
ncbi:hypothetical protein PR202_ga26498 [Eleusine coracana subsp. coracana]|uniref:BHLH domain-containing protein n=1 Tax=Eleusine coracana subsp. coracana TaxID=191504 RepID=A0AAV5DE87_ELECO|nr:hypothetical protein PR202_ga26498 [Eleusine coracana subsp. coracana]